MVITTSKQIYVNNAFPLKILGGMGSNRLMKVTYAVWDWM